MAKKPMDDDEKRAQRKEKFRRFQEKFKLGSHYGIERFGVITATGAVTGALLLGTTVIYAVQSGKEELSQYAMYTTDFVTSRTQQMGTVEHIFTSDDKTKSFVLMKLDSSGDMSTNANDYYAFVSGVKGGPEGKPEKVSQPTVGSIYSFGSTGYLGILLEAPGGFDEQLLNITIRAKKELVPENAMTEEDMAKYGYSEDFKNHDQWRVIFNPTGERAEKLDALNTVDGVGTAGKDNALNIADLYTQSVNGSAELDQRIAASAKLEELKAAYDRMKSYEADMETTSADVDGDFNVRLIPPALPDFMVGDEIKGYSKAEVEEWYQNKESNIGITDMANSMTDSAYDMDFTDNNVEFMNMYEFIPRDVIPGGYNFDWRNKTISDSYFADLVPDGASPAEYLSEVESQQAPSLNVSGIKWSLTNGKKLNDYASDDSDLLALNTLASNASQAYADYYKAKREYETDILRKFLSLELDSFYVEKYGTVNSGANPPKVDENGETVDPNIDNEGVDVYL